MTVNSTLAARVAEFEQRGYTILRGFNAAWVERWRQVFEERYRRESGEDQRGVRVGQPRAVLRGLLQERPDLFLPSLVAPAMLDFLEELMGPFVGFDSLQVAVTPPLGEAAAREVRAWHRDMWALPGWTKDYLPPNAVNVLTYLQEGAEYGRLRVIPGSHRGCELVGGGGPETAQAGEQAVELAAGDTVVVHSSLLHSTSGNYSGRLACASSSATSTPSAGCRSGTPTAWRACSARLGAARARGDRRVARLFEPDRELLARRAAGDRGEHTERELWQRWCRGRARRARPGSRDGAALPVGSRPRPAARRRRRAAAREAARTGGSRPGPRKPPAPSGAGSAAGCRAAPVPPEPELVLDARAELGEGPVWHAAGGTLYWVDLFAGIVHHYQPASGLAGRVEVGEFVGCVVPRARGGLLAATASGIYHLDPASGAKTRVAAVEADRPETHFNDGKVDPAGRFWFGLDRRRPHHRHPGQPVQPGTGPHRDPAAGAVSTTPTAWTGAPTAAPCTTSIPLTRQVTAFDYDVATGEITNPRPAVTLPADRGVPRRHDGSARRDLVGWRTGAAAA